jgi:asparaginyl-tRNA synthetase
MASETVFIDEDVGHDDDAASGTASSPYKTLLYAMIQHPSTGDGPTYTIRKSQTGPVSEDGDPSARLEWKPATKSALKKTTGLYEQHKRKQAKAAELAVREKEEALRATEGLGRS